MTVIAITLKDIGAFVELIGLLLLFIFILAAAYYTTRWVSRAQGGLYKNKNIQVLDTHKVTNNKFVQILRIGNKCIVIGIGKDEIHYLTEVDENELLITESKNPEPMDFKEILQKIRGKK